MFVCVTDLNEIIFTHKNLRKTNAKYQEWVETVSKRHGSINENLNARPEIGP